MRKIIKLAGLIGVVLGLAFAPTASATGGDDAPTPPVPGTPQAACAVIGQVTAPRTPTGNIGHGQYNFITTTITCVYTSGAVVSYDVNANGGTWGPLHAGACSDSAAPPGDGSPGVCAGSSTLLSYSDNSPESPIAYSNPCGDTDVANKGNIRAHDGFGEAAGWVKFLRAAPETIAWGEFCAGSGQGVGSSFYANLEFTPASPADTTGDPVVYDLRGAAVIYDTP